MSEPRTKSEALAEARKRYNENPNVTPEQMNAVFQDIDRMYPNETEAEPPASLSGQTPKLPEAPGGGGIGLRDVAGAAIPLAIGAGMNVAFPGSGLISKTFPLLSKLSPAALEALSLAGWTGLARTGTGMVRGETGEQAITEGAKTAASLAIPGVAGNIPTSAAARMAAAGLSGGLTEAGLAGGSPENRVISGVLGAGGNIVGQGTSDALRAIGNPQITADVALLLKNNPELEAMGISKTLLSEPDSTRLYLLQSFAQDPLVAPQIRDQIQAIIQKGAPLLGLHSGLQAPNTIPVRDPDQMRGAVTGIVRGAEPSIAGLDTSVPMTDVVQQVQKGLTPPMPELPNASVAGLTRQVGEEILPAVQSKLGEVRRGMVQEFGKMKEAFTSSPESARLMIPDPILSETASIRKALEVKLGAPVRARAQAAELAGLAGISEQATDQMMGALPNPRSFRPDLDALPKEKIRGVALSEIAMKADQGDLEGFLDGMELLDKSGMTFGDGSQLLKDLTKMETGSRTNRWAIRRLKASIFDALEQTAAGDPNMVAMLEDLRATRAWYAEMSKVRDNLETLERLGGGYGKVGDPIRLAKAVAHFNPAEGMTRLQKGMAQAGVDVRGTAEKLIVNNSLAAIDRLLETGGLSPQTFGNASPILKKLSSSQVLAPEKAASFARAAEAFEKYAGGPPTDGVIADWMRGLTNDAHAPNLPPVEEAKRLADRDQSLKVLTSLDGTARDALEKKMMAEWFSRHRSEIKIGTPGKQQLVTHEYPMENVQELLRREKDLIDAMTPENRRLLESAVKGLETAGENNLDGMVDLLSHMYNSGDYDAGVPVFKQISNGSPQLIQKAKAKFEALGEAGKQQWQSHSMALLSDALFSEFDGQIIPDLEKFLSVTAKMPESKLRLFVEPLGPDAWSSFQQLRTFAKAVVPNMERVDRNVNPLFSSIRTSSSISKTALGWAAANSSRGIAGAGLAFGVGGPVGLMGALAVGLSPAVFTKLALSNNSVLGQFLSDMARSTIVTGTRALKPESSPRAQVGAGTANIGGLK